MLLKLTQSKTRDGSHNKNRMKEMKCGPHSLQPTKGTSQNWITRGGRLLAWIGDQVRLKALLPNKRVFIYRGSVTAKMATPLSRDSELSDVHLESLRRRGREGCYAPSRADSLT